MVQVHVINGTTVDIPVCALLDIRLRERLLDIINKHGITTVVETGLDKGGSTILFSQMVERVIGVDNVQERCDAVRAWLRDYRAVNADIVCGNSPDVLRQLTVDNGVLPVSTVDASKTLFFLDAHWQAYWPLLDEIRAIPRGQGVLVMHDARVPGCPTLGVDEYDGQELSYEYLKDMLTEWSPTHRVEYNDETAEWPHRGVMFVFPK